jgi:orotidine-5'-phosphate decarboxylase
VGVLKVGLELFVREGPAAVELCAEAGCKAFLDLKLCDIPETVRRAVASACSLGAQYLTLHACGGPHMLEAATNQVVQSGSTMTLLAVTVLTSLDQSDLERTGVQGSVEAQVLRLATLAKQCGIGGLVSSPREVALLRGEVGGDMLLVTPGIRPASAAGDDQKRTSSPTEAIRAGADLLVVGRPIRDAADPARAARSIVEEIRAARATSA